MNDTIRFWEKVEKTSTCWNWTASKDSFGYGLFKFNKKTCRAHRVSYFFHHGQWPKITRHSCDNPACVNPQHLDSGNYLENNQDIRARGRNSNLLTDEQVQEIRGQVYDQSVVSTTMERYGLNYQSALNVLTNKTYPDPDFDKRLPRQKYRRKLSQEEVAQIKSRLERPYWGVQTNLAKEYGVSRNLIQRIQNDTY